MPCFDKKLEAIRFNLDEQTKEVDITLATNEVQNLINEFPANYLK
jgi:iron only hydrogenase large subunit-like protein